MRAIKRRFNGELPSQFAGCNAYLKQQKKFFKDLHRVKGARESTNSVEPGKLAYDLEGKYNGLAWVKHCFDKAMSFTHETPASTKYGYF